MFDSFFKKDKGGIEHLKEEKKGIEPPPLFTRNILAGCHNKPTFVSFP